MPVESTRFDEPRRKPTLFPISLHFIKRFLLFNIKLIALITFPIPLVNHGESGSDVVKMMNCMLVLVARWSRCRQGIR